MNNKTAVSDCSRHHSASRLGGLLFHELILWRKNLIPLLFTLLLFFFFREVNGSLRWQGTLANYTADRSITGEQGQS